jgi:dipeptidyl aminopeptidase/acylaminoacyl peptidase
MLEPIVIPFTEFGSIEAAGSRVAFRAGAPDRPTSVVSLDMQSKHFRVLKQATDLIDRIEPRIASYITRVEPVEFPTTGGMTAFGLFYPPHNPDYTSAADQPRHRSAGCQLRRQHRFRPRIPRAAQPRLGHR